MEENELIITSNGIEINTQKNFDLLKIKKIIIAYGLKVKKHARKIIIGRDTRPNGKKIASTIIEGLISSGLEVINLHICPIPVLIYIKNKLEINDGILISESKKPININQIRFISDGEFLDREAIVELENESEKVELNHYEKHQNNRNETIPKENFIYNYTQDLLKRLNINKSKSQKLRVVVDTGAGTAKFIIPQILENIGCDFLEINNDFNKYDKFPRDFNLKKENLKDLILTLWKGNYDIGFAYDCDLSNIAIIGDNFECYSEIIGSALIVNHLLEDKYIKSKQFVFLLNLASSLIFETLAEKNNIQVIKTYETNSELKSRLDKVLNNSQDFYIVSVENFRGIPNFPHINKVNDGIFITAKLIEILIERDTSLSSLVAKLPKYYSYEDIIKLDEIEIDKLINNIKKELKDEGEEIIQVGMNLRFGKKKDWFVLIHPYGNNIRVLSEAKRDSLARLYCETTAELLKLIISKL
jgi:phosphomannomutase